MVCIYPARCGQNVVLGSPTAINDWLDENGESKFAKHSSGRPEDPPATQR
jgi:hypothetical protein